MKKATGITCAFLDIGGVLLTDGWDHLARKTGGEELQTGVGRDGGSPSPHLRDLRGGQDHAGRVFEPGCLPPKADLHAQSVSALMFAQSKAFPEMIEFVAQLKQNLGLKIAIVSNEARELNAYRIEQVQAG